MQLNLSHITYGYPGAALDAVDDVTVTFPQGWTGIVGDNGCGKTTLARIAARALDPDSGTVSPRLHSAYCVQDPSLPPDFLWEFAGDWGRRAVAIRSLLAIEEQWPFEYGTLSDGQRKRLQLACVLWCDPDVLVVDEPTNDLDEGARGAVAEALAAFKGVGILISHDRALLDRIAAQCLMFEGGRFVMRPGGYSAAQREADLARACAQKARADAKREVMRLRNEAARRRDEAAKAKGRRSKKGLARGDSDGRERIGRAIVSGKDAIAGKQSASMERRLARAVAELSGLSAPKRYDGGMAAYGAASRGRHVTHIEAGTVHAGDFALSVPELWVAPTDHVAVCGDNGSGKSVFVRHLLTGVPATVRWAYVPQAIEEATREEALEALRGLDRAHAGQVLSIVGRLNSDPDRLLDGRDISPGELRKLLLAEQLLDEPELLVLDEPTNHLDMGSIRALEDMLAAFPGAFVLVTHDAALRAAVASRQWMTKRCGGSSTLIVA